MINEDIPVNVKMYLAGLFAGDGTVSVKKNGNSAAVHVEIGQTYKPTLDRILNLLNMGKVYIIRKTEDDVRNFHKQKWVWKLAGNDTIRFLEMILPYLPEKHKQSEHLINFRKWQNKYMRSGNNITHDQMLYCEKAIEESKLLKKQMLTIKDIEKYDLFKKKHYNPEIESGVQNTLDWFDDDYVNKKELENDNVKKVISPDINLDIIDGMTNPCFAGFFDAEGLVTITKNERNSKNDVYVLDVNINNSNFLILDKYCKMFGGSVSDPKKVNNDYKITWLWRINASNALNFLEQIYPFILEKREQIKLAIEFMNKRNNKTLTQEKAEFLHRKIKELKYIEYLSNEKTRIIPYGSNDIKTKMKADETLIQMEVDFHKAVMNNEDIEYDSIYFNNNYCNKDEFINNEDQSDLGF